MRQGKSQGKVALRIDRSSTTLRAKTIEALREGILSLQFKPGDRLIERELCEMLGVSRTSIREALRHLEAEGLITSEPHRGPVVATVTPEEAEQLYEVRAVLEGFAGRLFAGRASDAALGKLEREVRRYEQAAKRPDVDEVLDALARFYTIIFDECGNVFARNMIVSLRARMQYLRTTTMFRQSDVDTDQSIQNFRRILEAAKARNPDAMEAACVAQVRHASSVALQVLRDSAAAGE
ncbi:MAG: GntR family transcriptional regulator [Rhodospirillaceae bacterium]|nr:GntR family transcriptional regulator [Rhodospirillaceae bacterium]